MFVNDHNFTSHAVQTGILPKASSMQTFSVAAIATGASTNEVVKCDGYKVVDATIIVAKKSFNNLLFMK